MCGSFAAYHNPGPWLGRTVVLRGKGLAQPPGLDLFECARKVFELEMATDLVLVLLLFCPFLFEPAGGADFNRWPGLAIFDGKVRVCTYPEVSLPGRRSGLPPVS